MVEKPHHGRWLTGEEIIQISRIEEERAEIERYRRLRDQKWGPEEPIIFAPRRKNISAGAQALIDKPLPANPRGGGRIGPRKKR